MPHIIVYALNNDISIDDILSYVLTEKPIPFEVNGRLFCIYPVTLGKMFLISPIISSIGLNTENMNVDIFLEALRVVREKRKECCTLISYHSFYDKDDLLSPYTIEKRTTFFSDNGSDDDIASLLITLLTYDKTAEIMKKTGIERENTRLHTIIEVKSRSDKNNVTTGGKTIYGSFIIPLMELGMTWDEILWKRSYQNLKLLLSDKVNNIYISDDERRMIPSWALSGGTIKADDPKNKELIKSMNWK